MYPSLQWPKWVEPFRKPFRKKEEKLEHSCERRNQLHEVIRLSGMNLIIDDTDHPLIIKVASIQAARMQVYFIDNDDYFQHRLMATDENGVELPDTIPTDDIKNNVSLYLNVMSIKNVLSVASIWLMAIFLIISLFVIMNTIKLGVSARENEIKFMRLCGATKRFVRMPFMIEGIIIGIFAAILAFGIEFYLYEYLLKGIISSATGTGGIEGIKTASFIYDYGFKLGVGFTVIGLFAGVVASGISMKKFLKA